MHATRMIRNGMLALLAVTVTATLAEAQNSPARWVNRNTGAAPTQGAIIGGDNGDGRVLYICRAQHNGGWHPGKVHADMCHFGWGGKEIYVRTYQVLAGYGVWRRPFGDLNKAYIGGGSGNDKYRICRAPHRGGVHPGKVVAGRCNIGWGGQEIVIDGYEVLFPR